MFIILLISFSLAACQKDKNDLPDPRPASLPDLTLASALQLLPVSLLKENTLAIFVNDDGEELSFQLNFARGTKQKIFEGIKHQAEFVDVDYNPTIGFLHFLPGIRVEENYDAYDSTEEFLTAFIHTNYNGGFFPSVTMIDTTTPMFWRYMEHVTVVNRTFEKVFTNMVYPAEFDSYTMIYYTVEHGIVGFEGEQREMWALDRFE